MPVGCLWSVIAGLEPKTTYALVFTDLVILILLMFTEGSLTEQEKTLRMA